MSTAGRGGAKRCSGGALSSIQLFDLPLASNLLLFVLCLPSVLNLAAFHSGTQPAPFILPYHLLTSVGAWEGGPGRPAVCRSSTPAPAESTLAVQGIGPRLPPASRPLHRLLSHPSAPRLQYRHPPSGTPPCCLPKPHPQKLNRPPKLDLPRRPGGLPRTEDLFSSTPPWCLIHDSTNHIPLSHISSVFVY